METNLRNSGHQEVSKHLFDLQQSARRDDQSSSPKMTLDFDRGAQESSYDVTKTILERTDIDRRTLSSRKVLVDSRDATRFGVSFERGIQISNDTTAAISLVHNTFQEPYYTWSLRTNASKNTRTEVHSVYDKSGSLLSFDIEIPDRIKKIEYPSKYYTDSTEFRIATLASLLIADEELLLESNASTQGVSSNQFMSVENTNKFVTQKFDLVPEFTALPGDVKTRMYNLVIGALNSKLNQSNIKEYLKNEIYSGSTNEPGKELILRGTLDNIIEKYRAFPLKLTFTPVINEDAFDVSVADSKDVTRRLVGPFRAGTGEEVTIYNISYTVNKDSKISLEVDIQNNPKESKIIQISPQVNSAIINACARTTDRDNWQTIFGYKAINYIESLIK